MPRVLRKAFYLASVSSYFPWDAYMRQKPIPSLVEILFEIEKNFIQENAYENVDCKNGCHLLAMHECTPRKWY